MLAELAIDDLVLIASARLEFASGLNVITGETGAGKTLLAQGIGLLLGEKGEETLVRPGAQRALVQAVFDDAGDEFAVARQIRRGGRARAYLDGVVSSAAAIGAALEHRVAFYGQLEHARLLQLDRQLDLLDAAAGPAVAELLATYAEPYGRAVALGRELDRLQVALRDRERELDLLLFQVGEIEAAGLQPGEDERLAVERERQRNAARLVERVGGALQSLVSADETLAGLDALRGAQAFLDEAARLDSSLHDVSVRLLGVAAEGDDIAAALRAYLDSLEVEPERRDELELRFDLVQALKRKYGGSVDAVLEHASQAAERVEVLERLGVDETNLHADLERARGEALTVAHRLSKARAAAAPAFAEAVQSELRNLAMPHARLEVALGQGDRGWDALGPRGADEVEILFSANPGLPLRPLRETASGGELSRAMLAVKSVVHLGDDVQTLIFDEVDTGIGGRTAGVLGERLAALAQHTQIICITHLPQVAASAARHFVIAKAADDRAGTTETTVTTVDGEARIDEMCRMLGGDATDMTVRDHAIELLARAGR
jgi:DNA repair protein RecN (Recombination protein N)